MISNIVIFFVLLSLTLAVADNGGNQSDILAAGQALIIVAIIIGCLIIIILGVGSTYAALKYMKRKLSEPQYYVDNIVIDKYKDDLESGDNENSPQQPNVHHIFSVPYIATSVKQSMVDLGHSLVPSSFREAQQLYYQQNGINPKLDLPI